VRDSALKRGLVTVYFNARELGHALTGMAAPATYRPDAETYDDYWRLRGSGAIQPRFHVIAAGVPDGATLLDVGCGDGAMLEYLARTKGVRALGIDISGEAVSRAGRRGVIARVQTLADLRSSGETFDHVVMSEVVEHVADAERFVLDAWAVTRQSMWVTFPNIAYFPHRLRLLAGKFPVQWVVFPGEHLRFWSVPDFKAWLAALDIPATRVVPSNGLTVAGAHRVLPNLFGNQIVVRCDR
jgi:methionine biosynthesis protein MetW